MAGSGAIVTVNITVPTPRRPRRPRRCSLHSSNVAMAAGAVGDEIDLIAKKLVELGTVRQDIAEEMLGKVRAGETL